MTDLDVDGLADSVRQGDRGGLARAITLVESAHPDHRSKARELVDRLLPHTGNSLRLGISGSPGAGKSTFIEAFGLRLVDAGRSVAVLPVDPSSVLSGGSILGDKTRMIELSRSDRAFIRPSPSGGALGGIARRTREALLLCEAAGFDTVVVETVGVGQSEMTVSQLVDLFILLVPPAGGDDLQGIKRGIMELADLVVVTKADGDLALAASRTASDYANALRLWRPRHPGIGAQVLTCSAIAGDGIDEVRLAVEHLSEEMGASGIIRTLRSDQAVHWMWDEIDNALRALVTSSDDDLTDLEQGVRDGVLSPGSAAAVALARITHESNHP